MLKVVFNEASHVSGCYVCVVGNKLKKLKIKIYPCLLCFLLSQELLDDLHYGSFNFLTLREILWQAVVFSQ